MGQSQADPVRLAPFPAVIDTAALSR
jgi:hypothetical protein